MKEKLKIRLQSLQDEYQKGEETLAALEQETAGLKSTMLRISGAMQVLQELLEEKEGMNFPKEKTLIQNGKVGEE